MVVTKEECNGKTSFEGNLLGRTADTVDLSMKGRKISIPRELVLEVRLPKAKIEISDEEMKKLA